MLSALVPPDRLRRIGRLRGHPDAGYYYVQRVNKWQAPCSSYPPARIVDVSGAWGDNLTGDAKLKVGSPIRVELVLWDARPRTTPVGYTVIKLEPSKLDRQSDYGHAGNGDGDGLRLATPTADDRRHRA